MPRAQSEKAMAEGLRRTVRYLGSEKFEIKSVEGLSERKEKGRGCYGAVYEVRVHGVPCIVKRLHDILVGRRGEEPVGEKERAGVIQKFRDEVNILSRLRHPNLVQFLGVHYGRDKADISLIMEYMYMDLEHCITAYPNIPLPYKTSILRDVSYGLAYLHSMSIIHRDLNAGNVLLTEFLRAKIADLGVAKLFDRESAKPQTATTCPGARNFMPPESFGKKPKYDCKLDIFSVGHLILYLVNQETPDVTDETVTEEDFKMHQVQVGKRREALDQMGGPDHPLYTTAVQCLSDNPDNRPTSTELVKRIEEKCLPVSPIVNALELKFQLEQERMQMYQEFERVDQENRILSRENAKLNKILTQENECLRKEHEQLTQENGLWRKVHEQLTQENELWRKQCEMLTQEKECLRKELTQKNECLRKECEQLRYMLLAKELAHEHNIQLQSSHQV